MFELREYQKVAVENVLADWRDGYRKVLLMAATGTGKTVMFEEVLNRVYSQLNFTRALIIAHTDGDVPPSWSADGHGDGQPR